MSDLLRLVPQILAAAFVIAFFVLAAVVIFGTAIACVRARVPARRPATRGARIAARQGSSERASPVRS